MNDATDHQSAYPNRAVDEFTMRRHLANVFDVPVTLIEPTRPAALRRTLVLNIAGTDAAGDHLPGFHTDEDGEPWHLALDGTWTYLTPVGELRRFTAPPGALRGRIPPPFNPPTIPEPVTLEPVTRTTLVRDLTSPRTRITLIAPNQRRASTTAANLALRSLGANLDYTEDVDVSRPTRIRLPHGAEIRTALAEAYADEYNPWLSTLVVFDGAVPTPELTRVARIATALHGPATFTIRTLTD